MRIKRRQKTIRGSSASTLRGGHWIAWVLCSSDQEILTVATSQMHLWAQQQVLSGSYSWLLWSELRELNDWPPHRWPLGSSSPPLHHTQVEPRVSFRDARFPLGACRKRRPSLSAHAPRLLSSALLHMAVAKCASMATGLIKP